MAERFRCPEEGWAAPEAGLLRYGPQEESGV